MADGPVLVYDQDAEPLPDGPLQVVIIGRKGQGKTVLAGTLFESWPGDRAVLDVTGDVAADLDALDVIELSSPVPVVWPEEDRDGDKPMTLLWRPSRSLSHGERLAQAGQFVGMCFSKGDVLLWVDDGGQVLSAHQTPPEALTALEQGRHSPLWLIMTMPRPKAVHPLVISNADVIYAFQTGNPDDVRRLADVFGWPAADLGPVLASLEPHWFLRRISATGEVALFPPVPMRKQVRVASRDAERR